MKKKLILVAFIIIIVIVTYFVVTKKGNLDYEVVKISKYEYFTLKVDDKFGVIDNKGNIIIDAQYDSVIIPNPMTDLFICDDIILNKENEKNFDKYDVSAIKLENNEMDFIYEKSCLVYREDTKFGLIDFNEKKLTKSIFDSIETLKYKEGEMLVTKNSKKGVINLNGKYIVKPKYDTIEIDKMYKRENQYKEAGYIVSKKTDEGYRYGYVNNEGKEIIECKNNELIRVTNIDENIKDIYIIAAENGLYGVYKNEKKIIENRYNSISYDQLNNVYIVEKAQKYGVLDFTGKEIINIKYSKIDINGVHIYAKDNNGDVIEIYNKEGKKQNINLAGDIIFGTPIDNCYIRINENENVGYELVDKNQNPITSVKYMYIEHLKDDYFIINNGNSGIIDKKGNVIIEAKYDCMQSIKNVLIAIDSNKTGTIFSSNMKKICAMENINYIDEENYIKIYNETEAIYLDKDGKILKNKDIIKTNVYAQKQENGKFIITNKDWIYIQLLNINNFLFKSFFSRNILKASYRA